MKGKEVDELENKLGNTIQKAKAAQMKVESLEKTKLPDLEAQLKSAQEQKKSGNNRKYRLGTRGEQLGSDLPPARRKGKPRQLDVMLPNRSDQRYKIFLPSASRQEPA